MGISFIKNLKIATLRSYITIVVTSIVAISLLFAAFFFYPNTASILKSKYKESIMQKLDQINAQINNQIQLIDSINPMFMSNSLIRESLEPTSPKFSASKVEKKLALEKQMSYLLINTYLWNKKFVDSVYIFDSEGTCYNVAPTGNQMKELLNNETILSTVSRDTPALVIKTLDDNEETLYFIRNIYSLYTGDYIATVIININYQTWAQYYSSSLDPEWFVYLYNPELNVLTHPEMKQYADSLPRIIEKERNEKFFKDMTIEKDAFYIAAENIPNTDITSVVAAPQNQLHQDLNTTLETYLILLVFVALAALLISVILSRAITRPIDRMIEHVKRISRGEQEKMPLGLYSEFNEFADAFNHMLEQLDISYTDNFEKQLLLKNAEIRALQGQMDPHFLFNVLNTIAWKAQMTDNEEIYQMVISLGELLKFNTISKDSAFITLEKEIKYVKFYIYLQKMRFEDKISVELQINPTLYPCKIPALCIQPLVENAIVHGLEPKTGNGRLIINVIEHPDDMEISIIDDGVGFEQVPDIQTIRSSMEDTHTHIGLRNLDKRLYLLFGEQARLHISSTPNTCTTISFKIPLDRRYTL